MKKGEKRLAVEQPMHPIHYSAFEGSGVGTTLLHDVGVYEVLNSASGKRDKGADTDDDDEGEEDDCELLGGRRGMNHEKALARAYRGYPEEDMTSFVVKLTGVRYKCAHLLSSVHPVSADLRAASPSLCRAVRCASPKTMPSTSSPDADLRLQVWQGQVEQPDHESALCLLQLAITP